MFVEGSWRDRRRLFFEYVSNGSVDSIAVEGLGARSLLCLLRFRSMGPRCVEHLCVCLCFQPNREKLSVQGIRAFNDIGVSSL